jgi:hypothetical protein
MVELSTPKRLQIFDVANTQKSKTCIVPTQFVADDVNKWHLFTNRKTTVTLEASDSPLHGKAKAPENLPEQFIMYTGNALNLKILND